MKKLVLFQKEEFKGSELVLLEYNENKYSKQDYKDILKLSTDIYIQLCKVAPKETNFLYKYYCEVDNGEMSFIDFIWDYKDYSLWDEDIGGHITYSVWANDFQQFKLEHPKLTKDILQIAINIATDKHGFKPFPDSLYTSEFVNKAFGWKSTWMNFDNVYYADDFEWDFEC